MNDAPFSIGRLFMALSLYVIALCQITQCSAAQEQSRAIQRMADQLRSHP